MPRSIAFVGIASALASAGLTAQADHFNDQLLPAARRVAGMIPGDAPTSLRYVLLNPTKTPLAGAVDGAPAADSVNAAYSVFQIRFAKGWIVVDGGVDRSFAPNSKTFSDDTYRDIQRAMRDANLVVITHEHFDHVGGIITSPYRGDVQAQTLLTRAQVQSLITKPTHPKIKLDSAEAAAFPVIDYGRLMPIAPGVVLIKSPGHTTGSQLVYVRLASGAELIIAGDVAWNMNGIETGRHKPDASTRGFGGEDKDAVTKELKWLREVGTLQVSVLVSHDVARLTQLAGEGKLVHGFDLRMK